MRVVQLALKDFLQKLRPLEIAGFLFGFYSLLQNGWQAALVIVSVSFVVWSLIFWLRRKPERLKENEIGKGQNLISSYSLSKEQHILRNHISQKAAWAAFGIVVGSFAMLAAVASLNFTEDFLGRSLLFFLFAVGFILFYFGGDRLL